jgi:hypothetical protein
MRYQPIELSEKWDKVKEKWTRPKVKKYPCSQCNLIVRCIPPSGFKCPHGKKGISKGVVKK